MEWDEGAAYHTHDYWTEQQRDYYLRRRTAAVQHVPRVIQGDTSGHRTTVAPRTEVNPPPAPRSTIFGTPYTMIP